MPIPDFRNHLVLVTGGAGFIGSHLVDALLERGARVRVLDNFSTGRAQNLSHCIGRLEVIEGDIRDLEICQRACQEASYAFHEAALGSVPRSMKDPATTIAVNVGGAATSFPRPAMRVSGGSSMPLLPVSTETARSSRNAREMRESHCPPMLFRRS